MVRPPASAAPAATASMTPPRPPQTTVTSASASRRPTERATSRSWVRAPVPGPITATQRPDLTCRLSPGKAQLGRGAGLAPGRRQQPEGADPELPASLRPSFVKWQPAWPGQLAQGSPSLGTGGCQILQGPAGRWDRAHLNPLPRGRVTERLIAWEKTCCGDPHQRPVDSRGRLVLQASRPRCLARGLRNRSPGRRHGGGSGRTAREGPGWGPQSHSRSPPAWSSVACWRTW